ncbi:MAG: hypothetical protein KA419_06060 [Acidobacteria bacterium]|nr:hypothetical protein [Acidobacteriota bacterium]
MTRHALLRIPVLVALTLPAAVGLWGQAPRPVPSEIAREWSPEIAPASPGSLRLRVRFLLPSGADPPAAAGGVPALAADGKPALRLETVSRSGSAPPVHRSRRLAPGLLRVVGFDADGAECWRGLVRDPRPLRVEATGDPGRLSLREGLGDDAVADVVLPGDCPVHRLEIYAPRWDGTEHRPFLLGWVEVPRVP